MSECVNINLFVLFENVMFDTANEQNTIQISNVVSILKNIIENKVYQNNIFSEHLIFTFTDNFIIVRPCKINHNLHHINPYINNILHQLKYVIFDIHTYEPICYRDKTNIPSYLNRCMSDIITYESKDFDKNIIIYTNHIGSYIIFFFHNDMWYFVFNNNIYIYNDKVYPVLYEHINKYIDTFDKNICYHIMLVDKRTRKIIPPTCEKDYVILLKTTEKHTLKDIIVTHAMKENKRIYMSCLDELLFNLNERDMINIKMNKLIFRGYIMIYNNIYITYDTNLYKTLTNLICQVNKQENTKHHIYMKLYQQNKLKFFLQYINDDANNIIQRIKFSLITISREILDIYHLTRNKNNDAIYNLLPQAYKHILYKIHSKYISQHSDDKISISTDDVYNILKTLEFGCLKEIYIYREHLKYKLHGINMLYTKMCNYTDIECKLLSINYYE